MVLVHLTVNSSLGLIVLSAGDVLVHNGWVDSLVDSGVLYVSDWDH